MNARASGVLIGLAVGGVVGSGTGIVGGIFGGIAGFWLFVMIGAVIGYSSAPDILRFIRWIKRK